MNSGSAKRILIAPLDWGLGHTTRCVPIIRQLIACKCEVVFAGNDLQQTFIRSLFPTIALRSLPGYNVRYGAGAVLKTLLPQIPGLIRRVYAEHHWLSELCRQEHFDGIISDNRYGLWHPTIPSVILTHQPQVLSSFGKWADKLLLLIHRRLLSRFHARWIVDLRGTGNLGGLLSQAASEWPDTHFIGWLSQLDGPGNPDPGEILLVLLSGPEPQRSILSDLLWEQVIALKRPTIFIEGKASATREFVPDHIQHIPRSSGKELEKLINKCSIVICRSGYSTLMDLLLLRKRAILIPTPGQSEQEYLARHLSEAGYFASGHQSGFQLAAALERVPPFSFPASPDSWGQFQQVLKDWLAEI